MPFEDDEVVVHNNLSLAKSHRSSGWWGLGTSDSPVTPEPQAVPSTPEENLPMSFEDEAVVRNNLGLAKGHRSSNYKTGAGFSRCLYCPSQQRRYSARETEDYHLRPTHPYTLLCKFPFRNLWCFERLGSDSFDENDHA